MEEIIGIITVGILTGVLAFIKGAKITQQTSPKKKITQQKTHPKKITFKDIAKQKLV